MKFKYYIRLNDTLVDYTVGVMCLTTHEYLVLRDISKLKIYSFIQLCKKELKTSGGVTFLDLQIN